MKSNTLHQKIGIVSRVHVGMVRQNQEDNHLYSTNIRDANCWQFYSESVIDDNSESVLLLVADGMGGLEMGEMASEIACKTTKNYCIENAQSLIDGNNLKPLFNNLFAKINNDILAFAEEQGKAGELGTTLIISFIINKKAHVFWIGDSRCYVLRKGILKPVSKDHSYVQELVDQGKITYEQSFYHPESNIITKYMGDPKTTPEPSYTSFDIETGDVMLLCSDGLNGMLQDKEIQDYFYGNDDLEGICQNLIDSANEAGGHDNNTIILTAFGDFAKFIPAKPIVTQNPQPGNGQTSPQIITETKIVYILNLKMAVLVFLLGCILGAVSLWSYNHFSKNKKEKIDPEETQHQGNENNKKNATVSPSDKTEKELTELETQTEETITKQNATNSEQVPKADTHPIKLKDYPEVVKLLDEIENHFKEDNAIISEVDKVKNNKNGSYTGKIQFSTLLDNLRKKLPDDIVGKKYKDRLQAEIDNIKKQ